VKQKEKNMKKAQDLVKGDRIEHGVSLFEVVRIIKTTKTTVSFSAKKITHGCHDDLLITIRKKLTTEIFTF
jgi:hypothetical protein